MHAGRWGSHCKLAAMQAEIVFPYCSQCMRVFTLHWLLLILNCGKNNRAPRNLPKRSNYMISLNKMGISSGVCCILELLCAFFFFFFIHFNLWFTPECNSCTLQCRSNVCVLPCTSVWALSSSSSIQSCLVEASASLDEHKAGWCIKEVHLSLGAL